MIVPQYKPQVPQAENELHQLTLLRMQARTDADQVLKRLRSHASTMCKPSPSRGFMGALLSNISVILSGITVGKKLMRALRR